MRKHGIGAIALGAFMGAATAMTFVTMDPVLRRQVRARAMKVGKKAMRMADHYFR
jgi:hypothetical protein